jgi:hypothetical protein
MSRFARQIATAPSIGVEGRERPEPRLDGDGAAIGAISCGTHLEGRDERR